MNNSNDTHWECGHHWPVRATLIVCPAILVSCLCGCFEEVPEPTPTVFEEDVEDSRWCATIETAEAQGSGMNYPAPIVDQGVYPKYCGCVSDYWMIQALLEGSSNGVRVVTASDQQKLQDFRDQLFAGAVSACKDMASDLFSTATPPYTGEDCDSQLAAGTSPIVVDEVDACDLEVPYDYGTGDTGDAGALPLPSDHWSDYYTLSNVIQYNSSTDVYEIDEDFFNDMLANPAWLFGDSAYITLSGSDWTLESVVSGDIVEALGLESGDIPQELNSYDITSPVGALNAYSSLKTATSFTLVIDRRGSEVTLEYSVI